jgi:HAD superfamily hydrolase (TIGR01549 family)
MVIEAVAFDLDGTITKTQIQFAPYKKRIGCKNGDVLKYIKKQDLDRQQAMYDILDEYENEIAKECTLNDGFLDLMDFLNERDIKTGIITRSSRRHATQVIKKLGIPITQVIGREEIKPKPSGKPLIHLSALLKIPLHKMICVGDFLWDILAGKNAHVTTVLFVTEASRKYIHLPDYVIYHLSNLKDILEE